MASRNLALWLAAHSHAGRTGGDKNGEAGGMSDQLPEGLPQRPNEVNENAGEAVRDASNPVQDTRS